MNSRRDTETEGRRVGSPNQGEVGAPGASGETVALPAAQWTSGRSELALRPGGSLTLDFSCPRPGGTNPVRSRDRRQDARRSQAMAGGSGWPQSV